MREGEGNLGFALPTGLHVGLWTGSRHIFTDAADAAPDSLAARIDFVTARAEAYLPDEWRIVVSKLRSPAMTEQIVAQVFGGAMPDSGPALGQQAGVVALSRTLERVARLIAEFISNVWNARTWADLDAAAHQFAGLIDDVGPEAAFRIVTLGKGPVASSVADEMNLGDGGEIVSEDIIREYMGTAGDSKGDAKERYSKGIKSTVRRNIRQTLEFLNETDSTDPIDGDGPSADALEILEEMNLGDEVTAESLATDTVLVKTSDGRTGSWFAFQNARPRSVLKPTYYKVKGSVVALSSLERSGDRGRQLFIPRSMLGGLMQLPSGIDPPAPIPKPAVKKDPTQGQTGKPPGPGPKPSGKPALSRGDEAGTAKNVQANKTTPKGFGGDVKFKAK